MVPYLVLLVVAVEELRRLAEAAVAGMQVVVAVALQASGAALAS